MIRAMIVGRGHHDLDVVADPFANHIGDLANLQIMIAGIPNIFPIDGASSGCRAEADRDRSCPRHENSDAVARRRTR